MKDKAFPFLLILLLAGCQSLPRQGELYVYTDAQGNLVTIEKSGKEDPRTGSDTFSEDKALEDYRPSKEIDQELEEKERDRFISYVDERGQLVSRPVDMVEAREARQRTEPDYNEVTAPGFLETYRALRQDCCLHLLKNSVELAKGQEILIEFDQDSPVMLGEDPLKALALVLGSDVNSLDLKAFIRKQNYVAAQLLWLDEAGKPLLLIDQPFSRKYPENWYRYGYLHGILPREAGQRYLVVFLPYLKSQPATDGLQAVLKGELLLSAK